MQTRFLGALTDPVVAEFAARHGLEAAPPKAVAPKKSVQDGPSSSSASKPKAKAPKAKPATTRKARTKATAA